MISMSFLIYLALTMQVGATSENEGEMQPLIGALIDNIQAWILDITLSLSTVTPICKCEPQA